MAKIHFLGTASGTEPIKGMHHTCFCIEAGDYVYWFDAGENCSRNAHLSGIDLLSVRAVFISHTHMDHVGGLGNLLWNIRKLTTISPRRPPDKKINLFIPNLCSWAGILQMLKCAEGNFKCDFDIAVDQTVDGIIYEDETIKVKAYHNHHLQEDEYEGWLSFSYLIEVEGKKILFSGDVRDMHDLDDALSNGCDILLVETGHHKLADICEYAKTKNIGKIIFIHHGREIINDLNGAEEKLLSFPCEVKISFDGMVEEL